MSEQINNYQNPNPIPPELQAYQNDAFDAETRVTEGLDAETRVIGEEVIKAAEENIYWHETLWRPAVILEAERELRRADKADEAAVHEGIRAAAYPFEVTAAGEGLNPGEEPPVGELADEASEFLKWNPNYLLNPATETQVSTFDGDQLREDFVSDAIKNNWTEDQAQRAWASVTYPYKSAMGSDWDSRPQLKYKNGRVSGVDFKNPEKDN